jgi:uncharacterized protein (DUF302 family)
MSKPTPQLLGLRTPNVVESNVGGTQMLAAAIPLRLAVTDQQKGQRTIAAQLIPVCIAEHEMFLTSAVLDRI